MIKRFGRIHKLLLNERGMALVTSLLILTALTAIAVTAMNNTTIETMISGNDFQSQKRIYAAEGAANLVFASLPAMLSTINPNTGSIYTINDLLAWSYNSTTANRGDLTSSGSGNDSALYTLLGLGDMSSFYDPESGVATYSILIEDNVPGPCSIEDNDPYNDADRTVLLNVYRKAINGNSNSIASRVLSIEIYPLSLFNHDAAVNLIDPITDINFPEDLDDEYKIDATTETGKDGIVTTDERGELITSGNQDNVYPGIKYDVEANPSAEEIRKFKETLIRYATPITPEDPDLGNKKKNTVTVRDEETLTQVSYVQGNLKMINASGSGILVIEEYNDGKNDHMGLKLEGSNFEGLIIMFPKNRNPNFEERVKIELKKKGNSESSIDGIIVAGSSSKKGIKFKIRNSTEITYDETIAEGLLTNRYVVTKWSRRGN